MMTVRLGNAGPSQPLAPVWTAPCWNALMEALARKGAVGFNLLD
jgi:hypothetical protein